MEIKMWENKKTWKYYSFKFAKILFIKVWTTIKWYNNILLWWSNILLLKLFPKLFSYEYFIKMADEKPPKQLVFKSHK